MTIGDFNNDGIPGHGYRAHRRGRSVTVCIGLGTGALNCTAGAGASLNQFATNLVAGDFNGDGNLDIAASGGGTNQVAILLGHGDGTFAAAVYYNVGTQPGALVAGHFHGAGSPLDLAVVNVGSDTVSILTGNGNGTFQAATAVAFPAASNLKGIAAGDFDGDGNLDFPFPMRTITP